MRLKLAERPSRRSTAARRGGALLWAALLVTALPGCAGLGPLRARLDPDTRRPNPGVTLFVCDGVQADLLEQGCREGWLPNVQKRFVAGGLRIENAIAAYPAITYSVVGTFLSGATPARHGIIGNRWFDPQQRRFRNYVTLKYYRAVNADFAAPTLYERIRPRPSGSIQEALTRGVSDDIANWAQSGVRWFFGSYTGVDALTADTVDLVARHANERGEWPTVLTCYFPGADTVGHEHGPSSREYRRALENLDRQIGRVCDWLERQRLLETTHLILVSDHGQMDVRPDGFVDLWHVIRKHWGRRPTDRMDQDDPFRRRKRYFERFDTVVAYQNGRLAILYFAGPNGWDERPTPAEVERILTGPPPAAHLWNLPGVDVVAYLTSEREVVLRSSRRQARIVMRDGPDGTEFAYVPAPDDVLGYLDDPDLAAFVAEGFHPSRSWLRATCTHEYPDLVPHLVPLLQQPRAGQVLVCAAPKYSFVREAGGHGAFRRAEMRVPFLLAGPGITPGTTLECARAVDLVPTVLRLLGLPVPQDEWLEGEPLLPDIHARATALNVPG